MLRARGLLLLVVASAGCGAESFDSTGLLLRIRARVRENESKLPRYICRQRIVRRYFIPGHSGHEPCSIAPSSTDPTRGMKLASTDRVSLDVIIAREGEMFSWPGMSRFEKTGPGEVIGGPGLASSGDFAGFLRSIFGSNGVTFHFEGPVPPGAVRFSYQVPRAVSTYTLRGSRGAGIVGYKGVFDVDPHSADILGLTVESTSVPEGSLMCTALQEIHYQRKAATEGAFLIPSLTTTALFSRNGSYLENRTTYEACGQYGVESVLKFDEDTPAAPAAGSAGTASDPPPPGTELEISLATSVNSEVSWAGDRIEGISGRYLFRGRVTELEHVYQPRDAVMIGIRFDTIVLNGAEVPIALVRAEPGASGVYAFHDHKKAVLQKGFVTRWRVRTRADEVFVAP